MKFSILIPVYNVEKYLPECLEKIRLQTNHDYEVVLVDDGSTDGSGKICDEFKERCENVIVIHKKNEGLISARRAGIKSASGEYCIFCDSDDMLEITALEKLDSIISSEKPDVIIFNANKYDGKNKTIFFDNVMQEGIVSEKEELYNLLLLSYSINSLCLKCVRRNIIDENKDYTRFYDCNFGEDLLQSTPIIIEAERVYYLNERLYNYRWVAGMMHRYNPKYYWSYKKVNHEVVKLLRETGLADLSEKAAIHLLVAMYGATTQYRYIDKIDRLTIEELRNDNDFREAYKFVRTTKYYDLLSLKQKFVLNQMYYGRILILKILFRLRGK